MRSLIGDDASVILRSVFRNVSNTGVQLPDNELQST